MYGLLNIEQCIWIGREGREHERSRQEVGGWGGDRLSLSGRARTDWCACVCVLCIYLVFVC